MKTSIAKRPSPLTPEFTLVQNKFEPLQMQRPRYATQEEERIAIMQQQGQYPGF